MKLCTVLSLAVAAVVAHGAADSIEVKGNAFWDTANDTRFYIRGVDYQPGGSSNLTDPLAAKEICDRDIPIFEELGINTIRVYSVDNSQDHSYCMNKLQEKGIYLILDVNTPDASISRTCPSGSYNADYLQNVFATIDMFANYTNTLGFFAGNEVINDDTTVSAAPYVKAVVRDMKNYMAARNYRAIPVGYSSADIADVRLDIAEYFNCGNDSAARIDFLGINDYSWCGDSSFTQSGYSEKVDMYSEYSIPMFLSEYGCNEVSGSRPFTEVAAIYNEEMTVVFSGGLVYEYSEEDNNYGLVQIDSDTNVTLLTDFTNLKKEFADTSNPSGDGGYSDSYNISTCPSWNVTTVLPDTPEDAETYFDNGAGEGYGFDASTMYCDDEDEDDYAYTSTAGGDDDDDYLTSSSDASSSASKSASKSSASSKTSSSSSSAGVPMVQVPAFVTFFQHSPVAAAVVGAGVAFGAAIAF